MYISGLPKNYHYYYYYYHYYYYYYYFLFMRATASRLRVTRAGFGLLRASTDPSHAPVRKEK